MRDPLVVFMTVKDVPEAEKIARALVEKKLAACCNILPGVRSIYRWQGAVCDEPEVLITAKTSKERFPLLERTVRELHSYDVPEILALPVLAGSQAYLQWLDESLTED